MARYIVRRLLWMLVILLLISLITFALERAIPGGPFDREKNLPQEIIENLEAKYHLDEPYWKQYARFLYDVLVPRITTREPTSLLEETLINVNLGGGRYLRWINFGPSYSSRSRTVTDIIREQLPVSMQLGILSMGVALAIGLPLGILAALRQNTWWDYLAMSVAVFGVSVPVMAMGPVLVWIFGVALRWLPSTGWGAEPPYLLFFIPRNLFSWAFWRHAIMPACALGTSIAATIARMTRASMIQAIHEDYVRTARAKGLAERAVVLRHALRNALIPVVTILGPMFASVLVGLFVVEQVFGIPGLGRHSITSIINRDYPVIMGTILLYAIFLVVANAVVDIAYAWLDPRIRYEPLRLGEERARAGDGVRAGRPSLVPGRRKAPRYGYSSSPAAFALAALLQIEGRFLGGIGAEGREPSAYPPANAKIPFALASRTALALENARLYAQGRRRAEELAAVSRVARRISATLDLRETLDSIVEAAVELVPCVLAEISLWDESQQVLALQALRCEPKRAFPIGSVYPPGKGYTGWVVRNRRPLLVPNVDARQDIEPDDYAQGRPDLLPGELPIKAYVGLPLLAGAELIGTLVLAHDRADAFGPEDLRLLEGLAGQAAIAIRNARLYDQLARRHRELAVLNAVAAAINQALDLETLLADVTQRVIEVVDADAGALCLLDPESQALHLKFSQGFSPECVAALELARLGDDVMARVALTGEPALADDAQGERQPYPRVLAAQRALAGLREEDVRSFAVVPLQSRRETVGALGVFSCAPGTFGARDVELLTAIGHQLGMAVESVHLRQQALEAERLAAVGRVASTVAHDMRGPLGGIIRSAEFLARPELSERTREKLSSAIVAMARRLVNTAQGVLDYTRGGQMTLSLAPCRVSDFLGQVIEVMRVDFSERGIEVVVEWGYTGVVWIDPDRMAQVVYNIASNARDAMPEGGRLTIVTCQADGWNEWRFTDTGPGVPPEIKERIFEPFVSYGKQEGAGLGLAIARRIVREHGGEITIESPAGGGATFVVRLPLGERAGPTARAAA